MYGGVYVYARKWSRIGSTVFVKVWRVRDILFFIGFMHKQLKKFVGDQKALVSCFMSF